jgi:hypothetical protein
LLIVKNNAPNLMVAMAEPFLTHALKICVWRSCGVIVFSVGENETIKRKAL